MQEEGGDATCCVGKAQYWYQLLLSVDEPQVGKLVTSYILCHDVRCVLCQVLLLASQQELPPVGIGVCCRIAAPCPWHDWQDDVRCVSHISAPDRSEAPFRCFINLTVLMSSWGGCCWGCHGAELSSLGVSGLYECALPAPGSVCHVWELQQGSRC